MKEEQSHRADRPTWTTGRMILDGENGAISLLFEPT